jgi:hypothetical protein
MARKYAAGVAASATISPVSTARSQRVRPLRLFPIRFDSGPPLTLYPIFFPAGTERGPGLKTDTLSCSRVFVLPNPSGLNRAYPGFDKKLIWYRALAKLLRR